MARQHEGYEGLTIFLAFVWKRLLTSFIMGLGFDKTSSSVAEISGISICSMISGTGVGALGSGASAVPCAEAASPSTGASSSAFFLGFLLLLFFLGAETTGGGAPGTMRGATGAAGASDILGVVEGYGDVLERCVESKKGDALFLTHPHQPATGTCLPPPSFLLQNSSLQRIYSSEFLTGRIDTVLRRESMPAL